MTSTIYCGSQPHNLWLVLLAAAVCLMTTSTALRLLLISTRAAPASRPALLMFGGLCGGGGTWATHFIAMLAFDPNFTTAYDATGTLASLIVVLIAGCATLPAASRTARSWSIPLWGALFALGVGAMHYVGMMALRVPGSVSVGPAYVVASLVVGGLIAMLALYILNRSQSMRGFVLASICLAGAICSLHFIGMSGLVITLDPSIVVSKSFIPHRLMAVGVGGLTALIALTGLATVWMEARTQSAALRLFQSVIEAMPQALGYFDAADRYVLGNAAYRRELGAIGLQPEVGLPYRDILLQKAARTSGVTPAEQACWIEERLCARAGASSSFDNPMADGRFLREETNRTADGGVVTVLSDITGLKRQADDLAVARDLSEAAARAKNTFLATMSHELRTPLNGVLGMAHVMAAGELASGQRERLEVIRQSGEGLLAILNDILDMSKIEAGRFELEESEFDLGEVVSATQAAFSALAFEKGLVFDPLIDDAARGVYRGDPARVRQILYILISNALKFTERGEVRVGVARLDGAVRMTVSDTGIGMSPRQAENLFQKFVQLDGSATRRFGGTGLGLAICSDLIDRMGGSITVDSALGRGSIFSVTLPLARIGDAQAPLAAPRANPSASASASNQIRILAAEDNPINQLVLKTLLGLVGVEPVIVGNGAEAVEAWATGEWDVILMDVQMPMMDGSSATREIRDQERMKGCRRTPIIAVTANAMAHHVQEYLDAGMDRHVAKPIETARLFAAIESVLDAAGEATRLAS